MYALAFENHGRILTAWFPAEAGLAALLGERAEHADRAAIQKLRGP
jgi:hypothetical protein